MSPQTVAILRHREKARYTLARAIRKGQLPPARSLTCVSCGQPAKDYHHHRGYDLANWLDVVPMCRSCHQKANYAEAPKCQAIAKHTGRRCGLKAIPGTNYCGCHKPVAGKSKHDPTRGKQESEG